MLHELLMRQATAAPDAPAVRCAGKTISYGQLDALVERIAAGFRGFGVREGDRVALWLDKSIVAVAVMQATLRLGAAYVPLDPGNPAPRVGRILSGCEPKLLVTTTDRQRALAKVAAGIDSIAVDSPEWVRAVAVKEPVAPAPAFAGSVDSLAYVLYTSGSTGTPKGVAISHRNALAFIEWAAAAVDATATDRFANHAPFHFDLSVFDLYVAFAVGGSVSIIPADIVGAPGPLVTFLIGEMITVWYSVPSALTLMMDHGALLDQVATPPRVVIFAGEAFAIGPLKKLRSTWSRTRMFNFYGPTETNVCTAYEVRAIDSDRIEPVPIGTAASGNRVWLENAERDQAGPGGTGEVVVSGPTVMLGYLAGEPQDGRPYRTGDLARYNDAGELELIGRRDAMLKVRGHRIEPGEIENVLRLHPGVGEAAVGVQGSGGDTRLVAYLVIRDGFEGGRPRLLDIKRLCAEHLPRSMIVDRVRLIDAMPRTTNGKVDRRALAVGAPDSIKP